LYSSTDNKEVDMSVNTSKVSLSGVRCAISDIPRVESTKKAISTTVTEWEVPEGLFVEAINRTTGNRSLAPVTALTYHTDVDMYDIELSVYGAYKHIITCSKEGTLLAYRDGNIDIVDASKALGAVVPRAKALDKWMSPEHCVKYIDLGKQVPLTYDVGVFLGLVIGDGWVDANNVVRISAECKEIQDKILEITDPETTYLPVTKASKIWEYNTERFGSDKQHRATVYMTGADGAKLREKVGKGAYNKKIPLESLAASKAHRLGVLVGLIATDGSVRYNEKPAKGKKSSQKSVLFHTTSQELRDNIIDLCNSLGVRATATGYMGEHSLETCYAVNLSIRDVARLYNEEPKFRMIAESDEIPMSKIVAEVVNSTEPDPYDIVPYPSHLSSLISIVSRDLLPATERTRYKKRGYISRKVAKDLVDRIEAFDFTGYTENGTGPKKERRGYTPERVKALANAWISIVKNTDVCWEVVTDVKHLGSMDGWDITVPDCFTFALGCGTFVQDSMTTHVPVSNEAVEAVKKNMLPSKNLLSPRDFTAHFIPRSEFAQGLYLASRVDDKQRTVRFRTEEEAVTAYKRGDIKVDTPVEIG
jgi:hypothetical protein